MAKDIRTFSLPWQSDSVFFLRNNVVYYCVEWCKLYAALVSVIESSIARSFGFQYGAVPQNVIFLAFCWLYTQSVVTSESSLRFHGLQNLLCSESPYHMPNAPDFRIYIRMNIRNKSARLTLISRGLLPCLLLDGMPAVKLKPSPAVAEQQDGPTRHGATDLAPGVSLACCLTGCPYRRLLA